MVSLLGLNIWNYNEPWTRRRELIAQAIRQADVDLVALQEIRYESTYADDPRHQAGQILARLPGYEILWQPAMRYAAGDDAPDAVLWEGLAILSRLPVVDHRYIRLSRDTQDPRDNHQRIVLGARVMAPQGPFWFFNTHFSLSDAARRRTIVEAHRFVGDTAGGEPWAITGDFNARPDEAPIRFLLGQEALAGERGAWADAWACLHPTAPGYTHPAWEPDKRIDYLFVPRGDMVRQIEIACHVPDGEGIYPSDHLGLRAEVAW